MCLNAAAITTLEKGRTEENESLERACDSLTKLYSSAGEETFRRNFSRLLFSSDQTELVGNILRSLLDVYFSQRFVALLASSPTARFESFRLVPCVSISSREWLKYRLK